MCVKWGIGWAGVCVCVLGLCSMIKVEGSLGFPVQVSHTYVCVCVGQD